MFDRITRPIRAILVALTFRVSYAYAYAVLKIEDQRDAGIITARELAQAGLRLGEQYPDDVQRARGLR